MTTNQVYSLFAYAKMILERQRRLVCTTIRGDLSVSRILLRMFMASFASLNLFGQIEPELVSQAAIHPYPDRHGFDI